MSNDLLRYIGLDSEQIDGVHKGSAELLTFIRTQIEAAEAKPVPEATILSNVKDPHSNAWILQLDDGEKIDEFLVEDLFGLETEQGEKVRVEEARPGAAQLVVTRKVDGQKLLIPANTWTIERQRDAIQRLRFYPSVHHTALCKLFSRERSHDWAQVVPEPVDDWLILTDASREGTAEQRSFVNTALGTPDFAFLEGPPGSGKTTAICELVAQCVRRGYKVAVVSSTHVAVDNVLERLLEPGSPIAAEIFPLRVRSGSWRSEHDIEEVIPRLLEEIRTSLLSLETPTVAQESLTEAIDQDEDGFRDALIKSANVVCATTFGILRHPAVAQIGSSETIAAPFDMLILDEASKTTFQEFLVPALAARRWILVGDVKQLSPFVDTDDLARAIRPLLSLTDVEGEPDRARDIALNMSQRFQLRLSPQSASRYDEALKRLCEPAELRQMQRVERIAMPSLLESLQHGVGSEAGDDSILARGLAPDRFSSRHMLLRYQHRMHPDISVVPRREVYDDQALIDAAGIADERAWTYARHNSRAIWLHVPFRPSRQQRTAPEEVDAAVSELDAFAEWAAESGSNWTVAVVCLYAAQKRLFDRDPRIRERWGSDGSRPGVKLSVGTVDSFQGKEADLVVLSLAAQRQTSFLRSPNRINVALTRARSQLVIIGDAEAITRSDRTEVTLLGAAARSFPREFPLT